MRTAIRAIVLAGLGGLTGASAQAFTLENGTIWPLAVSIGGAPPQTVGAEDVAFLFRGQCPNGCTLSIAVADPVRAQTVVTGVGGDAPVIQGNGDSATVRVRMARGGSAITVEVTGDLASQGPTTSIGVPFSGSESTTSPAPGQGTVPALSAPASPAVAPAAPPATTAPGESPPGFLPPPPPPDY